MVDLLGPDAQGVIDWAVQEATHRSPNGPLDGGLIYSLIAKEAAIQLIQKNHKRGKITTKVQVRRLTGLHFEMPVLYKEAGLRHPQEARNLRHNLFHTAFLAYINKCFPDVHTWVPVTGQGSLTPDLMVEHNDPNWLFAVEYKGYRSITLLSESELLKGMRYQQEFGTAWLVTTTAKSVHVLYGRTLDSEELINNGITRLQRLLKKKTYTDEQRENRGIARKGITHLEKHRGINIRCKVITVDELLESSKKGHPKKGLAITTGMELVGLLRGVGLDEHADNIIRVMKLPTNLIHSDTVTSMRLIE